MTTPPRPGPITRPAARTRWLTSLLLSNLLGALGPGSGFNSFAATPPTPASAPLLQAHAHNDYEHTRPLLDALDHGFCSIEADIWLEQGQLLVAHDHKDLRPGRTLQSLYLDPLLARTRHHQSRIYPKGPPVTLLIDVKTDATNTYAALRQALQPYRSILTRFTPRQTETNALILILSGNRPRDWMQAEPERWIAYDGRLPDLHLAPPASPHFMPLVSDNWRQHFTWKGRPEDGPLPPAEREKLHQLVRTTHQAGYRIRFWGMPDHVIVWETLHQAGVDLINTDNLPGLAQFLRQTTPAR